MAKRKDNPITPSPVADEINLGPITKDLDTAAAARSVVDRPNPEENRQPAFNPLMILTTMADKVVPWGVDVATRDRQLRDFYPTEPVLLSAIYSVAARDSSFAWEIVPANPRDDSRYTRMAVTRMLENIGLGIGWTRFMFKTCISLYTQDNAVIWELLRREDRPDSPVINIDLLDPGRCTRTGNLDVPVIYQDRNGRYHEMKNYQVVTIEEMPSDIEDMYNVQICAVSRALRMAQILQSIFVYKDEKISGRNTRAIDFISGVSNAQIKQALQLADELANNKGFSRYAATALVPGLDPTHNVSNVRVDLASLPDGFDMDKEMQWYLSILAMAFGVDYQEFAPLPTGAMGSGSQSEILHLKTHGKGPATIMALFTHIFNNFILPRNVRFQFKDHDARTETEKANARYTRARDRALRISSGELDGEGARKMAIMDGDLPEWLDEDITARAAAAPAEPMNSTDPQNNQNNQNAQNNQNGPKKGQEMTNSPQQIRGAQQGALKEFIRGGMRGVGESVVDITEQDVEEQRRSLMSTLEQFNA